MALDAAARDFFALRIRFVSAAAALRFSVRRALKARYSAPGSSDGHSKSDSLSELAVIVAVSSSSSAGALRLRLLEW